MKNRIKYSIRILTIIFCILTIPLWVDLILFAGGHKTIIIRYYLFFLNIAIFSAILLLVLVGIEAIDLAIGKKWKKFIALLSCILFILVASYISVKVVSINSEKRVSAIIKSFLAGDTQNYKFEFTIDNNVKTDYETFLLKRTPSDIKLLHSSPIRNRYEFGIAAEPINSFRITLWVRDDKVRIWVHR